MNNESILDLLEKIDAGKLTAEEAINSIKSRLRGRPKLAKEKGHDKAQNTTRQNQQNKMTTGLIAWATINSVSPFRDRPQMLKRTILMSVLNISEATTSKIITQLNKLEKRKAFIVHVENDECFLLAPLLERYLKDQNITANEFFDSSHHSSNFKKVDMLKKTTKLY